MADAESPDDLTEQLMAIRLQLETFEHAMSKAVRGSYEPYHPKEIAKRLSESDPVLKWRLIEDFFEPYQSAEQYSIANLPALAYSVMDLKLQYYFVTKVGPSTWNALLSSTGLSLKDDPLGRPGLYLQHLYLMQAEIGQVRILWDRLMSLVYRLEEGRELQGKSIRRSFFKKLPEWHGRWEVLSEWEARIDKYDSLYRTPEFHKNSTLRASIFRDAIDPNDISAPLSPVMGGFWEVLTANITGAPSQITRLGRTVDPEFDEVPPPA
jgi:hypothetical protein